jgi:tetratricopeptide (TPR) repeat protein
MNKITTINNVRPHFSAQNNNPESKKSPVKTDMPNDSFELQKKEEKKKKTILTISALAVGTIIATLILKHNNKNVSKLKEEIKTKETPSNPKTTEPEIKKTEDELEEITEEIEEEILKPLNIEEKEEKPNFFKNFKLNKTLSLEESAIKAEKIIEKAKIKEPSALAKFLDDLFSTEYAQLQNYSLKNKNLKKAYLKAIELNPTKHEYHTEVGNLTNRKEALKHYKKAIELAPNHPEAYFQIDNRKLDGNNGVQYFYKALECAPEDPKIHTALGIRLNNAEGMAHLEKAVELDPKNDQIHYNIAIRTENDKAIYHYKKAIDLNPENITYQKDLAEVLSNNHRYEEAIPIYEKIVQKEPENWRANVDTAENYSSLYWKHYFSSDLDSDIKAKEYSTKAIKYFEKASQLDKKDSYSLGKIASMYSQNDYEKALIYYKKIVPIAEESFKKLSKPTGHEYYKLADVYYEAEEFKSAAKTLDLGLSNKEHDESFKDWQEHLLDRVSIRVKTSNIKDKDLIEEIDNIAKKHDIKLTFSNNS